MEKKYCYRLIPEWNSAFRILENCCYDQLVYQGEQTGLVGRFDKGNEKIGQLLCMCHEHPQILDITEVEFEALLQTVNYNKTKSQRE